MNDEATSLSILPILLNEASRRDCICTQYLTKISAALTFIFSP